MNHPRLVLGGAYSGVGKTSTSVAVMGALTRRGIPIQPYKVGPDYIDPAFHSFVAGVPSRNLDSWIVAPEELQRLFVRTAVSDGKGISVVEGVMGLYDGNGTTSEGGTAHVARTLSAPVVLIVNGEGIGRSLGALVRGYRDFDDELDLAGILINRVSGPGHYDLLKRIVETETGLRCYGYLAKSPGVVLEHRPLGLIPPSEIEGIRQRVDRLADLAEETIDLDGLLRLARSAPQLGIQAATAGGIPISVRIGIPRDAAFCAYYEDNLDLLRELGAELVFFDSATATALPEKLDGLYIGGGFPEIFAERLAANAPLRGEIRERLETGLPAYAEGGGAVYLCRRLLLGDGETFDMVGFFNDEARVTARLPHFGHITVTLDTDTPLGDRGTTYRANEFHRLEIRPLVPSGEMPPAYRAAKPSGASWSGGLVRRNAFASLSQVHFYANRDLASNFLARCREARR